MTTIMTMNKVTQLVKLSTTIKQTMMTTSYPTRIQHQTTSEMKNINRHNIPQHHLQRKDKGRTKVTTSTATKTTPSDTIRLGSSTKPTKYGNTQTKEKEDGNDTLGKSNKRSTSLSTKRTFQVHGKYSNISTNKLVITLTNFNIYIPFHSCFRTRLGTRTGKRGDL